MPIKYRILPEVSPQDAARFWSLVDVRSPDECWPWLADKNPRRGNYGRFWLKRIAYRANRMAYWLHYGIDPAANDACHKCDNPPCCNPSHLFKGTRAINLADMTHKHRRVYGEQHGISKLTRKQVAEIKRLYIPRKVGCNQLAERFGVSEMTIHKIISGKTWVDVKS